MLNNLHAHQISPHIALTIKEPKVNATPDPKDHTLGLTIFTAL